MNGRIASWVNTNSSDTAITISGVTSGTSISEFEKPEPRPRQRASPSASSTPSGVAISMSSAASSRLCSSASHVGGVRGRPTGSGRPHHQRGREPLPDAARATGVEREQDRDHDRHQRPGHVQPGRARPGSAACPTGCSARCAAVRGHRCAGRPRRRRGRRRLARGRAHASLRESRAIGTGSTPSRPRGSASTRSPARRPSGCWVPPWTNRLISLPSMFVFGEAEIRSLV